MRKNPLIGVMHFIRDAFFDVAARRSKNIFLIRSLKGNNDLSLLLEIIQGSFMKSDKFLYLEKVLEKEISKDIELKNVIIETSGDSFSSNQYKSDWRFLCDVSLTFTINGSSWRFVFKGDPSKFNIRRFWNFKGIFRSEHLGRFERYCRTIRS